MITNRTSRDNAEALLLRPRRHSLSVLTYEATLSGGISGANVHDSQALVPLVKGIPPIRSRRGPRRRKPDKLHADKGYAYRHLRHWLSQRGIRHRIARKGIETSKRLGRHRWTIERTMAWLTGCRRLHRRYEAQGRALPRLHEHRLHPYLLSQTHQMR